MSNATHKTNTSKIFYKADVTRLRLAVGYMYFGKLYLTF
jgi:hypothetical protein